MGAGWDARRACRRWDEEAFGSSQGQSEKLGDGEMVNMEGPVEYEDEINRGTCPMRRPKEKQGNPGHVVVLP